MNRHEHRLDCIKAYIRGYMEYEDEPSRVTRALEAIYDLAEGVDIADVAASGPD